MDRVFIEQLEVDTIIGVYDWERSTQQKLIIDLSMAWDNRLAAQADQLQLALDYAAVSEKIRFFAGQHMYALVETFAEHLAAQLMEDFGIAWLRLKVTKPGAVVRAGGVGVEIERGCH